MFYWVGIFNAGFISSFKELRQPNVRVREEQRVLPLFSLWSKYFGTEGNGRLMVWWNEAYQDKGNIHTHPTQCWWDPRKTAGHLKLPRRLSQPRTSAARALEFISSNKFHSIFCDHPTIHSVHLPSWTNKPRKNEKIISILCLCYIMRLIEEK